jgi:hypothetical protein
VAPNGRLQEIRLRLVAREPGRAALTEGLQIFGAGSRRPIVVGPGPR